MKRFIALVLSLIMALSLCVPAWATEGEPTKVSTQDAFVEAVAKGGEIELADGNYVMPDGWTGAHDTWVTKGYNDNYAGVDLRGKTLTITGSKKAVIDVAGIDERDQFVTGAKLTFDGVTLNFATVNYMGFANPASLTYKDCAINGLQFLMTPNATIEDCVLNSAGAEHCTWSWSGDKTISFTGCDFTYGDRAVNCYGENGTANVSFTDCTFTKVAGQDTTGAIETNSAALTALNLTITNCTVNDGDLWWVSLWDSLKGAKTNAIVDGKLSGAVAETNGTQYKTLAAAVDAGGEVKLLADVTENIEIKKGVTLDLGTKTLNGKIIVDTTDACVIKNGTIDGTSLDADRCIVTMTAVNLEVTDVKMLANTTPTVGETYSQALTISGYDTDVSTISLEDCEIDGNPYYAIIAWTKTNLTIDNCDLTGYAAVYMKPATSGTAGTNGSVVNIKNSTLTGIGAEGDLNAFGTVVLEDTGVTVNVYEGTMISATGTQQKLFDTNGITGNTISISGGYFTTNVSEYVADGYICAPTSGADTYTVQKKVTTENTNATTATNTAVSSDAVVKAVEEATSTTVTVAETTIELTDAGKDAFQTAITENTADPTNKPLEIETEIAISDVSDTLDSSVEDALEAELKDVAGDAAEIAAILDIDIHVFVNDQHVGQLTELPQPITITLDLPEIEEELKDGYRRSYFVIIHHDGEAEKIPATVSGDKLIITSDRFSPYALGYVDTEIPTGGYYPYYPPTTTPDSELVKSPDTFDAGVALYVGVSIIGAVGTVALGKKRED